MRAYRVSIYAVLAFAAIYPVIAGGVLVFGRSYGVEEIFPFAPWALFCFVPNEEVDYGIQLHSVNGQPLDLPRPYEEFLGLDPSQELRGYAMIQRLAQFSHEEEAAQLESQLQQFEESFLHPHLDTAKFELIKRRYDVLERWTTGAYRELEAMDQFSFEKQASDI